jgi:CRISPR/Cas system-associated exonuclease Cas4 (RecB family)
MLLVERYDYKGLKRETLPSGTRYYLTPGGAKVPSVTTILSKTKDMTFLNEWKKRVGEDEAAKIVKRSVDHGNTIHKNLENYILTGAEPEGNIFSVQMTKKIIENGIKPHLREVWGVEAPLYAEGLYAGTTDLVGLWDEDPAIMDFKNSRKMKRREWLEDYFLQLCAYAMAHNEMTGTKIKRGVIMMASHDGEYQHFILEGAEFDEYCVKWAKRLEDYYTKFR